VITPQMMIFFLQQAMEDSNEAVTG